MKPSLVRNLSKETFLDYYWLKTELQEFCRDSGMSASGSKEDLTERIALFLETGKKSAPKLTSRKSGIKNPEPISLQTVITNTHRCSQDVRAFFKEVIGSHFHFSTYIQIYFKQNVGKTYEDAIAAWHEEEERKKSPDYERQIGAQFQYNQFTRDFFQDPQNKGKTRQDAIDAWNKAKKTKGTQTYQESITN
ncbi:DUF6434 domain-containing protein [Priestia koreensis]|uniref:DUF6434 domain-containing protein n=1 Tax=Priestia koreensis TaxID=284581 RepID=UPI001F598C18|nr:DUF6434 domain-containing protein [Priestia koreensis]UNL82909.1 cytoplasmic protein [Priestia koreensis]